MGPFETAGGDAHTYGMVQAPRAVVENLRGELVTGPYRFAFTVLAGERRWGYVLDGRAVTTYPTADAARAACDLCVAGLVLAEVIVFIEVEVVVQ